MGSLLLLQLHELRSSVDLGSAYLIVLTLVLGVPGFDTRSAPIEAALRSRPRGFDCDHLWVNELDPVLHHLLSYVSELGGLKRQQLGLAILEVKHLIRLVQALQLLLQVLFKP